MERRVVVTGLGAVSPVGNTAEESWKSVKAGKSGIGRITLFDASDFEVKIAGEVKGFDIERYGIPHRSVRKMARFTQLFLASTVQAVSDAQFTRENLKTFKAGIATGCCLGGFDAMDDAYRKFFDENIGASRLSPVTIPMYIPNEAAANASIFYGLQGMAWTVSNACASGTDAIGLGLDLIRAGRLDVCVAGGTEAAITPICIASLTQLGALARHYNDNPEKASRPFDRDREGFVFAEGACTLVLEEREHAKKRGAKIYAEIAGYGSSSDAFHITSPLEDGSGAALAARSALEDAGISADQIAYYNAHGTSTIANDKGETNMLKAVFGATTKLHISSTKSMTGHLVGAAGALEAMFTIRAMEDGFIPPTINLENPDTTNGLDLDYTAHTGVPLEIPYAMSGSLGFGGHNGFLVFKNPRL